MKIAQILFFLSLGLLCLAQSSNPFEIRTVSEKSISPADSVSIGSAISLEDPINSTNPFEVGQSVERIKNEPQTKLIPNKVSAQGANKNLVIGVVSFLSLMLMAFGISLNQVRVLKLFQSLYNTSSLKTLYRGTKGLFESQYILLYLIFIINLSLFALLIMPIVSNGNIDIKWWSVPCSIIAVYVFRHVIMALMSFIFPIDSIADLHNYNIGVHNIMLGMVILPIVIGIQFGPDSVQNLLVYLGLLIVVVFYLFRQIKGLIFAFSMRDFNLMYFFIYLCAVEISPILISLKATGIVE